MVVHFRTGLPHGHLLNRAEDMKMHAQKLTRCATQLREAGEQLQASMASFRSLVDQL